MKRSRLLTFVFIFSPFPLLFLPPSLSPSLPSPSFLLIPPPSPIFLIDQKDFPLFYGMRPHIMPSIFSLLRALSLVCVKRRF